jgi:ankyrin repeat protein
MSVKCLSVKGEAERKQSAETLEVLRDLAEVAEHFESLPLTLDPTGNNPLVWAAEKGQAQTAGFLLAQGVDVNRRGYMGNTALARAARGGHVECLRVLLGFPDTNPNIAVLISPDRD